MKIVLLLLSFLMISSCSVDEDLNPTLVGSWRLIQVLADPGDGSGVYTQVDDGDTLTFLSNGRYNLGSHFCLEPDGTAGSYNRELMVLTPNDCTSPAFKKPDISYQFEGALLVLNPMCIEPCGMKYSKLLD